jgi:hypothetical protein
MVRKITPDIDDLVGAEVDIVGRRPPRSAERAPGRGTRSALNGETLRRNFGDE